jgi:hypothetical protein
MVQGISFMDEIIKTQWRMKTRSILVGLLSEQLLDSGIWVMSHGLDQGGKTFLFTINVILEDPKLLELLGVSMDVVAYTSKRQLLDMKDDGVKEYLAIRKDRLGIEEPDERTIILQAWIERKSMIDFDVGLIIHTTLKDISKLLLGIGKRCGRHESCMVVWVLPEVGSMSLIARALDAVEVLDEINGLVLCRLKCSCFNPSWICTTSCIYLQDNFESRVHGELHLGLEESRVFFQTFLEHLRVGYVERMV